LQQFKSRVIAKKNSGLELLFASRLALRLDSAAICKVLSLALLLQTIQPVGAEGTSAEAARRSLAAAVIAPSASKATSGTKTTSFNQSTNGIKPAKAMAPAKGIAPANGIYPPKPASKTSYSQKALRNKVRQSYPRTHMEKGFYLKQKNDPNGALLEFLKATQTDPRQVKGFYEQALIFRARGYRKLAESSLEQALAVDPRYNEARILLATVQLEQGNLGGAVQELSRSLGLDSNDSSKDSNKVAKKDSNENSNENSSRDPNKDSNNSVNKDSPATESAPPQQNSGLLSIDVPAILQSIHGVIKTPSWLESLTGLAPTAPTASPCSTASSSSSSEHQDVLNQESNKKSSYSRKGETGESTTNGDSKIASLDANALPSEIDQSEDPDKQKHKKSKHKKEKKEKKEKKSKKEKEDKSLLSMISEGDKNSDIAAQNPSSQQKAPESTAPIEQKSASSNSNNDDATILANIKREANSEVIENNSEKSTATPAKQEAVFGNSPAFNVSKNTRPVTSILSNILSTASQGLAPAGEKQAPSVPKVKLDDDDWAKKLKNYAEHGASSLKNGEAFMFSEETGEASLFLADGATIRRIVAQPKDSNEVMRERRPDISHAEDVLYGLSLLGKLIPKFDTQPITSTESVTQPTPEPAGTFRGDNLMTSTQSFWGWLKSVCKF
jgi:tetratricopeptide (TPR) repeat protein